MTSEDDFNEFLEVHNIDTEFYLDDVDELLPDGSEIDQPAMMLRSYNLRKDKEFRGFRGRDYNKIVKFTDKDYDTLSDINLNRYLEHLKKIQYKLEKLDNNYVHYKNAIINKLINYLKEAKKLASSIKLTAKNKGRIKVVVPGFFYDGEKEATQFYISFDKPHLIDKLLSISIEVRKMLDGKILLEHSNQNKFEKYEMFDGRDGHYEKISPVNLIDPIEKLEERHSKECARMLKNEIIDYRYGENLSRSEEKFSNIKDNFAGVTKFKIYNDKYFKHTISYHKDDCEKLIRRIELIFRRRRKRAKQSLNYGYVYVMSNKAYPNIYKIGSTYGLPEERAEELTGTGHLHPFKVEISFEIKDAEYYEKKIHKLLDKNRVNKNREFFEIDLPKLRKIIEHISIKANRTSERLKLSDLKSISFNSNLT